MKYESLLYDLENGVATITINRPDSANAMNPLMARELSEVALQTDVNPEVRAILITGAGKMFCAGGDLDTFAKAGAEVQALIQQMATDLHVALSRFARCSAPVIAAVNGTAAGAGFSLTMAADIAIASDTAIFTMAYTNAGLSPDGGSTYFMPRKLGDRRARELMLTNKLLSAEEALEWGVVNQVVSEDMLLEIAYEQAKKLAKGPTAAFGATKTLLARTFETSLEAQMELESRAIAEMAIGHDGQEGIQAFLAKRRPVFKGS
tara:strand:- start:509 stop:1297 length:789 start_codon:yes stop_codon:yes gene_type:complete